MVIDYIMNISKHANERITERFYNLIDVDFLESKVVDVDTDTLEVLTNTCNPASRKALDKGFREIKLFENLGVYGVINKSTLELITVFPHENKALRRIDSSNDYGLIVLTEKAKQMQDMSRSKRNNKPIGLEMNRVCRKLALLKKTIGVDKKAKTRSHIERVESELVALRRFAISKIGEDAVYEFIESFRATKNNN